MTSPQIREKNRKYGIGNTRGMRILRLMVGGDLMTCPKAQKVLGGSIQTARNVVCALVTQKLAVQETAKGRNFSATYRITDAGRLRVRAFEALASADDELDADEAAERAIALSRVEGNIAWARRMVPKSVFDLGHALSKPYFGASA